MRFHRTDPLGDGLGDELDRVSEVFPGIATAGGFDEGEVSRYYSRSFWAYALFHSWRGSIHMAISRSGKFCRDDYREQARLVAAQLQHGQAPRRILEIGCGKGFNAGLIARQFPHSEVIGLDLNPRHIAAARSRHRGLPNLTFVEGSFDRIRHHAGDDFDLIFAVECFCHSIDPACSLASVGAALGSGGKFVTIDGFRGAAETLRGDLGIAAEWVEKSMIVPRFLHAEEMAALAAGHGLTLETSEDLSQAILPNLLRLRKLAQCFFLIPALARLLSHCLTPEMTGNAIAGLLMPTTVARGAHRYLMQAYRKSAAP